MEIDVNIVIQLYKEELANTKDELLLRKAAQMQLEKENADLAQRLEELEKQLRGE